MGGLEELAVVEVVRLGGRRLAGAGEDNGGGERGRGQPPRALRFACGGAVADDVGEGVGVGGS